MRSRMVVSTETLHCRALCVLVPLLCIAILVQMLGVPATLFDGDTAYDSYLDSILTGYTIPLLSFAFNRIILFSILIIFSAASSLQISKRLLDRPPETRLSFF